jgi:excinuclease ABC subunit A
LDNVVPDPTKSLNEGAIQASGWNIADQSSVANTFFKALAKRYRFSMDTRSTSCPRRS